MVVASFLSIILHFLLIAKAIKVKRNISLDTEMRFYLKGVMNTLKTKPSCIKMEGRLI